jgi:hypothetical protein
VTAQDSTKRQKPSLGYKSESYTESRSGYKQWAHVLPREMRSFKHERLEQILNEIYCDTIFERACKPGYSIDLYCIRPRQEERMSQVVLCFGVGYAQVIAFSLIISL